MKKKIGKQLTSCVLAAAMVVGGGAPAGILQGIDGLLSVEVMADVSEPDYDYELLSDGTIKIIGYNGSETVVMVPDTIDRKTVSSIGSNAFTSSYCSVSKSITEIILPSSITSIGASAFSGCSSLMKIQLQDSVTSIGASAFSGCSSLTNLQLPDSVTSIGDKAFANCSKLVGINWPESVTSIPDSVFYGCSSLVDLQISDSVTSIGDYAFYGCSSLTEIQLPENVTIIGSDAFSGCSSLTEIQWPVGVQIIQMSVFLGCSSLTKVQLPEGVTSISDYAFENCSSLSEIYLPDGLSELGEEVFKNCSSLQKVDFPNNDVSIMIDSYSTSNDTFDQCPDIVFYGYLDSSAHSNAITYNIPFVKKQDITSDTGICLTYAEDSFSEEVLSGDISLQVSELSAGDSTYDSIEPAKLSADENQDVSKIQYQPYEIAVLDANGESVQPIADVAVKIPCPEGYDGSNCRVYFMNMEDGTMTDMQAAWNYEDLSFRTVQTGIYIVAELQKDEQPSQMEDDFTYTLESDGTITITAYKGSAIKVTVPDTIQQKPVTKIADKAFASSNYNIRTSIIEVTLPDSITSIGNSAFQGCSNLRKIQMEGVTSIGVSAFQGCRNLRVFQIPEGVTYIGADAFENCSRLKELKWPEAVTVIKDNVFSGCIRLAKIQIPDSVTSIGNYAFKSCSSLIELQISDNVTSIGTGAFNGCNSLTEIQWPIEVECIPSSAFSGCSSLTKVQLPVGVTRISAFAFADCSNLREIYLPDGLSSIGESAFTNCSSLQKVDFPDNDVSMNDTVFFECQDIVFYGYLGSSADEYAAEYKIDFVEKNDLTSDSGICLTYAEDSFAEEVLSGGITLQASELTAGDSTYDSIDSTKLFEGENKDKSKVEYSAYEITVLDAAGEKVQPIDEVTVKITCPDSYIGKKCKVYYMAEDGTLTDAQAIWSYDAQSFQTSQLGTYIVAAMETLDEDASDGTNGDVTENPDGNTTGGTNGNPNGSTPNGDTDISYGDVNGDGEITLMDSALIRRYLAGWSVTIDKVAADVDGDGNVSLMDSALIRRYLAGWAVTIQTK